MRPAQSRPHADSCILSRDVGGCWRGGAPSSAAGRRAPPGLPRAFRAPPLEAFGLSRAVPAPARAAKCRRAPPAAAHQRAPPSAACRWMPLGPPRANAHQRAPYFLRPNSPFLAGFSSEDSVADASASADSAPSASAFFAAFSAAAFACVLGLRLAFLPEPFLRGLR